MSSLSPGTRLGSYEVLSVLGEGGMGAVYRARDTKLGREVAIKLLRPEVADSPERLARFRREAQLLAALNHPNIAQIYGLDETHDWPAAVGPAPGPFLVLELVGGMTLADRIARGPLTARDATTVAIQIAQALEAAHEQGIVHRDLKPANISLRDDGTVKVLDFGLAKAADSLAPAGVPTLTNSPTLTSPAMSTGVGVLLGTAHYMAPEQARGKAADKRADIWAFGCVLFEMLTGRTAFAGDDLASVLASVLTSEPDWSALPGDTPAHLLALLRRCLAKDPRDRLRDIGDARLELASPRANESPAPPPRATARGRGWLAAAALLAGAVAGVVIARALPPQRRTDTGRSVTFEVNPPAGATWGRGFFDSSSIAIDATGQRLAISGLIRSGQQSALFLKTLDSVAPQRIVGTEGAGRNQQPSAFSPDGRELAFYEGNTLKRLVIGSGTPQAVTEVLIPHSVEWASNELLLISTRDPRGILKVAASGGTPEPVTVPDTAGGERAHRSPHMLPDGKHFLYHADPTNVVYVGELGTSERRKVLDADSTAVYAPPGLLYFVRQGLLMKQPFDAKTLELTGEATPVANDMRIGRLGRTSPFAAGPGIVAFRNAVNAVEKTTLSWVDARGNVTGTVLDAGEFNDIWLSANEKRAVLGAGRAGYNDQLLALDLDRPIPTSLTPAHANELTPVLSPDGETVAFSADSEGTLDLFTRPFQGGPTSPLFRSPSRKVVKDWSRDGKYVLSLPGDGIDLLPTTGGAKPIRYKSQQGLDQPRLSPDGRWMAFVSRESGRYEVFIEPVPATGERIRVSQNGGAQPQWSDDGTRIYYLTLGGAMMRVPIARVNGRLVAGAEQQLFQSRIADVSTSGNQYALAKGERFLMLLPVPSASTNPITVILEH